MKECSSWDGLIDPGDHTPSRDRFDAVKPGNPNQGGKGALGVRCGSPAPTGKLSSPKLGIGATILR